jgi:NAD(P)H-hydrate epimerase
MKSVTSQQMREIDQLTISKFNISAETLMYRAGSHIAKAVERIVKLKGWENSTVLMVAGKGNNGGDAFASAHQLSSRGIKSEILLAGYESEIKGPALTHYKQARSAGITVHELPDKNAWQKAIETYSFGPFPLIVDGLLGTGTSSPPRSPIKEAIEFILANEKAFVISIDIPSGLDPDTGIPSHPTVIADLTVTMGLPKQGLLQPSAIEFVGSLEVGDIGIPAALLTSLTSKLELITAQELKPILKRRKRNSHKGMYGHVLVLGGSSGYTGAPALSAWGALKAGAGLVSVIVPPSAVYTVSQIPELMVHVAEETKTGSISARLIDEWKDKINNFDAILIGPGMSQHPDTKVIVEQLLMLSTKPVVLDADGLNCLAGATEILGNIKCPLVITPHPGEMARLLECTPGTIQSDRQSAVMLAAEKFNAVVVLKGAGTLVCKKGVTPQINMTGNPGMASAGMGDVLSGIIAGLVAQGLSVWDSARLGVFIHGTAGDYSAWRTCQQTVVASDVIQALPEAFRLLGAK